MNFTSFLRRPRPSCTLEIYTVNGDISKTDNNTVDLKNVQRLETLRVQCNETMSKCLSGFKDEYPHFYRIKETDILIRDTLSIIPTSRFASIPQTKTSKQKISSEPARVVLLTEYQAITLKAEVSTCIFHIMSSMEAGRIRQIISDMKIHDRQQQAKSPLTAQIERARTSSRDLSTTPRCKVDIYHVILPSRRDEKGVQCTFFKISSRVNLSCDEPLNNVIMSATTHPFILMSPYSIDQNIIFLNDELDIQEWSAQDRPIQHDMDVILLTAEQKQTLKNMARLQAPKKPSSGWLSTPSTGGGGSKKQDTKAPRPPLITKSSLEELEKGWKRQDRRKKSLLGLQSVPTNKKSSWWW